MDRSEIKISEGTWVIITHLNQLPRGIASRNLGTRKLGATGIVIAATVPGFDSDAILVEHREPFGEQNGERAIYFSGEFESTYDLPPSTKEDLTVGQG